MTRPPLHPEFETGFRLDETPWEQLYEHANAGEQPAADPEGGAPQGEIHPGEENPPQEIIPNDDTVPPEIPTRDPRLGQDDPDVLPEDDDPISDYEDWQPPGSEVDGSLPV